MLVLGWSAFLPLELFFVSQIQQGAANIHRTAAADLSAAHPPIPLHPKGA